MADGHRRDGLLHDGLLDDTALADSAVVANRTMNRERQLAGVNSYARELGFSPLDVITSRLVCAPLATWQPARAFDLITCVHGLHYIGDKLALLARAAGWRVVSFPYDYLGADDRAGPGYTGQPAVHSYYAEAG